VVIYGLHNGDGRIRYVGRTSQPLESRLAQHRSSARAGKEYPVYSWMRNHGPENVQAVVLEECDSLDVLPVREQYWIEFYKGRDLTNAASYLDGALSITPEQRERISTSLKDYFANNPHPHLGMKRTPETRAKIAAKARGRRTPGRKISPDKIRHGELHHASKLTEADVRQIISEGKWGTLKEIAAKWGVHHAHIGLILRGKTWTRLWKEIHGEG
jgi:hypothetical protein